MNMEHIPKMGHATWMSTIIFWIFVCMCVAVEHFEIG